MADEISLNVSLSTTLSSETVGLSCSTSIDLTDKETLKKTQTILHTADQGTAVQLDLSGLATLGYVMVKSMEAEGGHSVYVSTASGCDAAFNAAIFAEIKPGGCLLICPKTATYYYNTSVGDIVVAFCAVAV
jgi:hypothetical protein